MVDGDRLHAAILAVHPGLSEARFLIHDGGWDCRVVEAGGLMFKFPRHARAAQRLTQEVRTLAFAARHASVPLPRMQIHSAAEVPLFTEHRRLDGALMVPTTYTAMALQARESLAKALAASMATFHAVDLGAAQAAGCPDVPVWPSHHALADCARTHLSGAAAEAARALLAGHEAEAPDERVFGHFDSHGENVLADPSTGRLMGLIDFGHAGCGPLQRDLSYPAFIGADCARRVGRHYGALTGRTVDVTRALRCHLVLRLVELHDAAPADVPTRIQAFTDALADCGETAAPMP